MHVSDGLVAVLKLADCVWAAFFSISVQYSGKGVTCSTANSMVSVDFWVIFSTQLDFFTFWVVDFTSWVDSLASPGITTWSVELENTFFPRFTVSTLFNHWSTWCSVDWGTVNRSVFEAFTEWLTAVAAFPPFITVHPKFTIMNSAVDSVRTVTDVSGDASGFIISHAVDWPLVATFVTFCGSELWDSDAVINPADALKLAATFVKNCFRAVVWEFADWWVVEVFKWVPSQADVFWAWWVNWDALVVLATFGIISKTVWSSNGSYFASFIFTVWSLGQVSAQHCTVFLTDTWVAGSRLASWVTSAVSSTVVDTWIWASRPDSATFSTLCGFCSFRVCPSPAFFEKIDNSIATVSWA